MSKYKKVLLQKDNLTLELRTTKINDGSTKGNYYSYLYIYDNGKHIAHKPLFCKQPKAKDSFESALRVIGDDHEKTFDNLVSKAVISLNETVQEFERARIATEQ